MGDVLEVVMRSGVSGEWGPRVCVDTVIANQGHAELDVF
jgi:hypothetical protein